MKAAISGETCGARTSSGAPCKQPAGARTSHLGFGACYRHGGTLPNVITRAQQEAAEFHAMRELARFGQTPAADPEQALLDLVSQSAALVRWYGDRVAFLVDQKPDSTDLNNRGSRDSFRRNTQGYDEGAGLFGPVIDVDKDGAEHVVGEEERGMVKAWNAERDRLAKYTSAALKAGIEKRRIEMAESQGQQIVVVVNRVLISLGLDEALVAQARTLMAAEFRQIAQEAGG